MEDGKYQEKIKKVLAMIEGAKTEGEAQAASLALQRLVAKSGLSVEEIERLDDDDSSLVKDEVVGIGTSGVVWKRTLGMVIAENYRCEALVGKIRNKSFLVFVGLEEDAKIARECFKMTQCAAKRCLRRYSDEYRANHGLTGSVSTAFKNAYYLGLIEGLKEAYSQQRAESDELAIALQVPAIVKRNIDSRKISKMRQSSVTVSSNCEIHDAGYQDGFALGTKRYIA